MRLDSRPITLALVLATAAISLAQTGPGTEPAQTAAPTSTSAPSSSSQKPHLPIKARTHDEYVAYQEAIAKKQDAEAMGKAAADFAAKFPDSDIRVLLYRASMKAYRAAGESDKMMQAAMKVLALTQDDPEALLAVAQVQEEHTSAMDLDREQRMDQAIANAEHALKTIDTDLIVPENTRPDSVEPYKKNLRSIAYAIIGSIHYKQEEYPEAEASLRQALEADPDHVDGVVVLRLALCLDQQEKYQDALQQANHAVELTKDDTDAGRLARNERERLTALLAQNNSQGSSGMPPESHDKPEGQ